MYIKKIFYIIVSILLTIIFSINVKALDKGSLVYYGQYYQTKVNDEDIINYLNNNKENNYASIDNYKFLYATNNEYFASKNWYALEPIEWEIIKEDNDSYTLLSKNILFRANYSSDASADMSWSNSDIRKSLNEFYDEWFSESEKNNIIVTNNKTYCYPYNNAYVDKTDAFYESTEDKIYILSEEELSNLSSLTSKNTDISYGSDNNGRWWLRGNGKWNNGNLEQKSISSEGELRSNYVTNQYGIRPVIKVKKTATFRQKSNWQNALKEKEESSVSEIEYLALSELAYCNCDKYIGKKISETDLIKSCTSKLSNNKISHNKMNISEKEYVTKMLNYLKDYKIIKTYQEKSGFYAVSVENEKNHILAFRGSQDLSKWKYLKTDWYDNVVYGFFNQTSSQIKDAMIYTDIAQALAKKSNKLFSVTGHSLGGGLAILAGNYANVKAIGFDSSPTVDVSYLNSPIKMSKNFNGIDMWKSIDYSNERCPVGALDKDYKNYYHLSNRYKDVWSKNPIVDFNTSNLWDVLNIKNLPQEAIVNFFSPHHRWAITDLNNNNLELSNVVKEHIFNSNQIIKKYSIFNNSKLYLGSSANNKLNNNLDTNITLSRSVMYGGKGNDNIIGSSFGNDTLIGGKGNDKLTDDNGNETYIYWKGDGQDTIFDYSGNDKLKLYGFNKDDKLSITSSKDYQIISYGNSEIIKINKHRGILNITNSFVVEVYDSNENKINEIKLQDWNNWKKLKKYIIACPTKVEIYDKNDNLVLTLENETDEVINNEYGSFYVNNEDGELVKYVLLDEEYKFKILATDNGHMDFYTLENNNNELTIKSANNIEISKNEIFEVKNNNEKTELYNDKNEIVNLETTNKILATSINVTNNVSIELGSNYSLNAKLNPSNSNEKIYYKTMDSTIATVDEAGKIKGISVGNTKINVYTDSGLSKEINVTIKKVSSPKKTSIKKLTAKKKALKVTWKKTSGVKGYQIQYSLKKNFKGSKTVTITKSSTTSKTISKLKRRKKYYVRVRTYREVLGKKYYSAWSSSKNKKTK